MKCFHDVVIEKAAFGFACCRIILNNEGAPVDYEIEEVNEAYKTLSGITQKNIEGKSVSEVAPPVFHAGDKEWLGYFAEVALNGIDEDTEYFSEAMNKWFHVQVFSRKKFYFVIILNDITHKKYVIDSVGRFIDGGEFQANLRKMCDDLQSLTGAKYVALNIANMQDNGFTTRAITGIRKDINKAAKMLGFTLEGKEWLHNPDRFEKISRQTITRFKTMTELSKGTLGNRFSQTIEKTFGLGETVVVSIMKSGKMLGDFTLMMPKGTTLKNESLVEMYSRQTALLLEYYQSKQDVNHFFEVSPDLMLVINQYGNMLRLNTAWHRTLGFPVDTLTGRKIMEFIHPEDVAKTKEALKEILDKQKINNFVNRYVTIDNNYRSLEWRATLQGELVYAAARDITEKLEAEKEVQEKSELQKTLINIALRNINLPLSGKEKAINDSLKQLAQFAQADRAYIFDYLWEEEITRNTYEWCAPGISPQMEELQAVPLSLVPEWVATHKKGEIMYVSDVAELPKESGLRQVLEPQNIKSLITIPMMENGACVGFVGFDWVKAHHEYKENQQMWLELFAQMLVNIRVRSRMEHALISEKENVEKADRLKTAFLNNISHELRTPLNGIIGFAELMCLHDNSQEETTEYFKLLEKNTKRLLKTMHDYKDISALTSNSMTVNESSFSLHTFCGRLDDEFSDVATATNVTLDADVPAEDVMITGDEDLYWKIFIQLIDNAIKFSPGGKVEYGCRIESSCFVGYVKDTGVGIPEELHEKVFHRFMQEDSSDTRRFEGSGLGLSIVKEIVNMLDGDLSLDSVKGKGTHVDFRIPMPSHRAHRNQQASVVFQDNNAVVLIVEDDYTHQEYLRRILKKKKIKTIPVNDGMEALRACKELNEIKLVLMDIKMPGMDGLEATKQIKRVRPELPVIAITAYVTHGDKVRSLEAGCDDYIAKPMKKKLLYEKMQHYGLLRD